MQGGTYSDFPTAASSLSKRPGTGEWLRKKVQRTGADGHGALPPRPPCTWSVSSSAIIWMYGLHVD